LVKKKNPGQTPLAFTPLAFKSLSRQAKGAAGKQNNEQGGFVMKYRVLIEQDEDGVFHAKS
jgi:hypothetical protein